MIAKIKLTKPKDCLTSSLVLAFAIYTHASSIFTVQFEMRGQRLQGFVGVRCVECVLMTTEWW